MLARTDVLGLTFGGLNHIIILLASSSSQQNRNQQQHVLVNEQQAAHQYVRIVNKQAVKQCE